MLRAGTWTATTSPGPATFPFVLVAICHLPLAIARIHAFAPSPDSASRIVEPV
jgi:hypothetical protein